MCHQEGTLQRVDLGALAVQMEHWLEVLEDSLYRRGAWGPGDDERDTGLAGGVASAVS